MTLSRFSARRLLPWAAAVLAMLGGGRRLTADDKPVVPLRHAHAHNDYEHTRPLFDALDHGFNSVEADIFLADGKLLVGHTQADLRPDRTLAKLYLDPLRQRVLANRGKVYPNGPPFYLLIDVKTEAKSTYTALHDVLASYADLFTTVDHGEVEPKAITVVISGNIARDAITAQAKRYAAIDGRPPDLDSDVPAHLIPWISDNWALHFRWRGDGPMPEAERAKLRDFVAKAHKHGRMVRFWATPERVNVWEELRAAGVDLLNTDKLDEMQKFLLKNPK